MTCLAAGRLSDTTMIELRTSYKSLAPSSGFRPGEPDGPARTLKHILREKILPKRAITYLKFHRDPIQARSLEEVY